MCAECASSHVIFSAFRFSINPALWVWLYRNSSAAPFVLFVSHWPTVQVHILRAQLYQVPQMRQVHWDFRWLWLEYVSASSKVVLLNVLLITTDKTTSQTYYMHGHSEGTLSARQGDKHTQLSGWSSSMHHPPPPQKRGKKEEDSDRDYFLTNQHSTHRPHIINYYNCYPWSKTSLYVELLDHMVMDSM